MIRIILIAFVLLGFTSNCDAQDSKEALLALHKTLAESKEDTSKVNAMFTLAQHHRFNNRNDSTVFYGAKVLQQSRALGMAALEIQTLNLLGLAYAYLGDYAMKRSLALKSLKLSRLHGIEREEAIALLQLGIANRGLGNHELSKKRYLEAIPLFRKVNDEGFEILTESSLGMAYYELGKIDSAFICQYNALKRREPPHSRPIEGLGRLHYYLGSLDSSMYYFNMHKQLYRYQNYDIDLWRGRIFNKQNQLDSAQRSVRNVLEWGLEKNDWPLIISAAGLLSEINESSNPAQALEYSKMALTYTDSLSQMRITNANENISNYNDQVQQYEINLATTEYQNQVRQYALLAGILVFMLIGGIIFYFYRQKHKSNIQLISQRDELNTAIKDLKSTQAQLIQSEKMASLGELTAGIAHEIQNPLNFVNNFSEVNQELLHELNDELNKGNIDEARLITKDVVGNEEKIHHHGKRADAIVKGMLQHSRSSSGQKEPTDLNALCDEYLRLAYHGLKAKDKSFESSFHFEPDESLPKVNVVPQDIGRVLLNLINNAFYAVHEKAQTGIEGYKPEVIVKSRKTENGIELLVKDNGNGIPDSIKEKIFQPFFTTKPTGQGTGLGLSLSYDIVKAHGGELSLNTDGVGTVLTITIPTI